MDDAELEELRATARHHGMTLSAWVRSVLRAARPGAPAGDSARKLKAIRAAAAHDFPTGDIEEMLRQTQRGYLQPDDG